MRGTVLFALAALVPVPATQTGILPLVHPEIVRVDCDDTRGSAFWVSSNILLSVAHVTSGKHCKIDGEPINVLQTEGDFAILKSERVSAKWLKVDCRGFVKGRKYSAIGFARGLDSQTSIDVKATGGQLAEDKSKARLWGIFVFIPGQSGGPVIDSESGQVVGTINSYISASGDSGSVELRGTSVCQRAVVASGGR